jgi:hypothetical protein
VDGGQAGGRHHRLKHFLPRRGVKARPRAKQLLEIRIGRELRRDEWHRRAPRCAPSG